MQFVADLHLHSKYSRAVSKNMILPIIARYARQKGINIVSAPDWTHGLWFKEIQSQLEEAGEGLYKLKTKNVILGSTFDKLSATPESIRQAQDRSDSGRVHSSLARMTTEREPLFLLATEIASIYSYNGKVRRIHNLVFAPNLETAGKINKELVRRGCNLLSDGRPIIGISSKNLLELILSIDQKAMLIPCHVWTPHFGVYGSASGFDSLEEAFGELATQIYGIETGLSSDPEMNWQMTELKNRSILSFSDAHSPAKMGREATVFQLQEPSYENIRKAIMWVSPVIPAKAGIQGDAGSRVEPGMTNKEIASSLVAPRNDNKILYTIEFYPEEGKYHFSGHRNCGVVFGPEDIKTKGNTCPVCKKRLTEGVLFRVGTLGNSDSTVEEKMSPNGVKWYTDKAKKHPPYIKLVPLLEVLAQSLDSSVSSQKTRALFDDVCTTFGSEIEVLLKTPIEKLQSMAGARAADGIKRVREGNIVIDPGYDGEYGKVKIWRDENQKSKGKNQNEKNVVESQMGLF